jgi:hypothetical protein
MKLFTAQKLEMPNRFKNFFTKEKNLELPAKTKKRITAGTH